MMPTLIDAAVRSLFVAIVVALGLRAFRIRNVFARKAALGFVLIGAFAMPMLMPITARIGLLPASANIMLPAHPMTLLEELQARLQSRSGSNQVKPITAPLPVADSPENEDASDASPAPEPAPPVKAPGLPSSHPESTRRDAATTAFPAREELLPAAPRGVVYFSFTQLMFALYVAISALLLLRFTVGLAITLRLWLRAVPVDLHSLPETPAPARIRASDSISSPLTVGSGILLPADYESWDKEKIRIVLAHERSHVLQGDFYWQLLAGLYAALVWFSPLGWWIKRELADLSEAISDRAGIEEAQSHTSYAQILLEFAAAPRVAALGVAMARPSSLARRIERLLNEQIFHQSFAGGRRRAVFTGVFVAMAFFAGTAMVRVQAASNSEPVVDIVSPVPPVPVSTHIVPPIPVASQPAVAVVHTVRPEVVVVNDLSINAVPSVETHAPVVTTTVMAIAKPAPSVFPVFAFARPGSGSAESGDSMSFDRTLSVGGEAQLILSTGSGNIHLKRGSDRQIHIHGKVHVNDGDSADDARAMVEHPPIEQSGDVIRVGQHEQRWHGISIDYEVEAPAGTLLGATSGSGDIVDEGVGRNAKIETGSGDIRAIGLNGPFEVKTGSGNIVAEQTGQGDVKAETGSGDLELKDIHGSFHGQTGSGDIKVSGTPSAQWMLQTGSGNIEMMVGSAPMTLDASTGSGSVVTDHEMLVKGSLNQHHIMGNLNGGGPLVRVQTGSGDVRVH